ncbi:MAG: hypothetical protein MUC49_15670 [Raineya sp.]|jgi:hypothetical protein|nr:hypothetical protein [Raineya sp.]
MKTKELLRFLVRWISLLILTSFFFFPIIWIVDFLFDINFNYAFGCLFNLFFCMIVALIAPLINFLNYHSVSVQHNTFHAYPEMELIEKEEIHFKIDARL